MSYTRHFNIKALAFILLVLCVLGYAVFRMQNILTGPVISVSTPQNGAEVGDPLTNITGTTKNISTITLDGRTISIDEHGAFGEKLLLSPGYNIITLYAEDKFGRSAKKTLELIYTAKEEPNGNEENNQEGDLSN